MNMFARFDENPAMTLRVIKETKRYGRTDARTDGWTDGQCENSIPLQTKFAGGIIISCVPSIYTSTISRLFHIKPEGRTHLYIKGKVIMSQTPEISLLKPGSIFVKCRVKTI